MIPNLLFEVFKLSRKMCINEIKSHFGNRLDKGIEKYFKLLEEEDYGFTTTEPESFPEINLQWDSPNIITNAIIDFDSLSQHPFRKIIQELDELGCIAIQLRFYHNITITALNTLLDETINSGINSIELVLRNSNTTLGDFEKLCYSHRRIRSVVIHSSEYDSITHIADQTTRLVFTQTKINSEVHCGVINSDFFSANIGLFSEGQKFNSCLNRKISVDSRGVIRNCPSVKESFGNIHHTKLKEVINDKSFTKYWNINKDQITICKDCEFRYVCTDCRAYLSDPNNTYSKPAKCAYDPYTATWIKNA
jgi:SPASM domain peptide maturase of grasp-with-spasm system